MIPSLPVTLIDAADAIAARRLSLRAYAAKPSAAIARAPRGRSRASASA